MSSESFSFFPSLGLYINLLIEYIIPFDYFFFDSGLSLVVQTIVVSSRCFSILPRQRMLLEGCTPRVMG